MIENLYKQKLLRKTHVRTYADLTGTSDADVEDMFGDAFYLDLVNNEYAAVLPSPMKITDLAADQRRVVVRLEQYFASHPLAGGTAFSHYRPAHHFAERVGKLKVPVEVLDRFEAAFKALNELVKV